MTKLINKIEIDYFRSVHRAKLDHCTPLNILVGGNDSGKSNVLRALNLFFKNETDLKKNYDFKNDLSVKRAYETQIAKTKAFISVKIEFNNVFNFSSLPEKFTIKKQWNRYWDQPDQYILPKFVAEEVSMANITKFLNRIEFHYVPAIKSSEIFSHFLRLLYSTLIDKNVDFSTSSQQLSDVINKATNSMSSSIKNGLGISSRIDVPEDLGIVFADLDFKTNVGNGEWLPLKHRGDGIQVRHIPYILDFISQQHKNKKFIWAYEEPENSLEMNSAFELAKSFENEFSKRNQIFLTTHSPSFYSLKKENTSKWHVEKSISSVDDKDFTVSNITSIKDVSEVDAKLGVAALITNRAKAEFEKIELLNSRIEELNKTLTPTVICEGKTDVIYIKHALKLAGKESLLEKFNLRELGENGHGSGSENLKKCIKLRKDYPYQYNSPVLFIFDCDVRYNETTDNNRTSIFNLEKNEDSPFSSGIENIFPNHVAETISSKKELWNKNEKKSKGGLKTVVEIELNKAKACDFVIRTYAEEEFQGFNNLIQEIDNWINSL